MIIAQARPVDYDKAIEMAKGKVPDKPVVNLSKHSLHKIWDNHEIIADVPTDDAHFIRIVSGTIDGYRYVTLREFYYNHGDGEFKAGKNGIRIPMFAPFYTEGTGSTPVIKDIGKSIVESFMKAIDTANTMPLVDKNNSLFISTHYNKRNAVKLKETSNNENQQP